jgi:hypothetical protein
LKRANILILSLVLAIVIPTQAPRADDQKLDIQELYTLCKAKPTSAEYILCIGYISGVGDLMSINGMNVAPYSAAPIETICGRPTFGAQVQTFIN